MNWRRIFKRFSSRGVIVYADFIDPFSYIGFENLRRSAEAAGIPIRWRGFEYNPDTPQDGYQLQTGTNSDLRKGMWASVKDYAERAGLSLVEPQRIFNSRRAHLMLRKLGDSPQKNHLISRLYQAYFNESLDLSRVEVLREIASPFGFTSAVPAQAFERLDTGGLEAWRDEAKARRFPGLPGFVYDSKSRFGALPSTAWENVFRNL